MKPLLHWWSLEMPEMSGKCKSNPTKTNNLIYILKITQKMRKQTQKRGNLSTNWEFETFFENRKRTQKRGNGPEKRGNRPKKWGNRSTNWEFEFFYENRKRTQKMRKPINKLTIYNFFWKPETDPKKGETDQQTESLKLFLKTGNWPKKGENGPKKTGNESNVNIAETDPRYSKISDNS